MTNNNKHGPIYPPEDEVSNIRGAPGLHNCKSPPGYIWLADYNTCALKPPGPLSKFRYKPRNGIALLPPVESRPGGAGCQYFTSYDSLTRGSPKKTEPLNGWILPACLNK